MGRSRVAVLGLLSLALALAGGGMFVSQVAADTLVTTEYQITTSDLDETQPTLGRNLATDLVVYTQIQPDGLGDIWYQPLVDGAPDGGAVGVTSTPGVDEELNDVSGDYIVYTSTIDGVVIYRISDAASWSFGDPLLINDPHIDGNWVIWLKGTQVMLYDLNDLGTGVQARRISSLPASLLGIGDRFAVWVEAEDIVVWDLADSTATLIGTPDSDISPTTSGAWVAWVAGSGPTRIDAVNMDDPTLSLVSVVNDGSLNLRPTMHGDLIAWESNAAGNFDIWVYRLSTGEAPFQVTTDPIDQQLADVYGNLVAYVDKRAFNKDVWVSTLEFVVDPPTACSQPPAGLVSWWPGDGDALDLVGENDGTIHNEVTFGPGKVDEAFVLDGVDDWVSAPGTGIDGLQELTMEAWVRIDALNPWPQRFVTLLGEKAVLRHDGANQLHQLHFYMNFGGPPWEGEEDIHHIRVDDVLYADIWYHVAGSYDGSVMRLYLQGELVGSHLVSGTLFSWNGVKLPHQSTEGLDGLLDEVSIYNRALSASEIQSIFGAGTAGKCKALASLIDFIQRLDLRTGTERSLVSSLEDAQANLTDEDPNNDEAACVNLSDFIKKVDKNVRKGRLAAGDADLMRQSAEAIRADLGCP